MSRVFSLLRQAHNGPRIKTALVKDSDGNLIATEANCLERWKEHFSLLLQHGTFPADPTISLAANAAAPSVVCSTSPVTSEEVRAALGKLNNRKAPGIYAITAEMLRGVILLFWKRKGDRLVCSNHRGITLLSIPSKLFTRILLTRALPAIRSSRRPQQAGLMPNRSTIDQISTVRLLIEKTYEFRKDCHLYIGFIDLKVAFDTVCHTSLWRFGSGVPGVSFGSYHLTGLEYADDNILLSTSYSQLRDALAIYSEEAEKLGLQVSWMKTKFMYVSDRPYPPSLRLGNEWNLSRILCIWDP
ncbi:gamma-aminobutyric acid receptor subunit alpha-2-like [Tachysurus ichikawai]